jgi:hypothetical protein
MNDKAGQMNGSAALLFPMAAAVVAIGVTFLSHKVSLPSTVLYALYFAAFAAASWASTFLTKAGKGTGIATGILGTFAGAAGSYVVTSILFAAALGKGSGNIALTDNAAAVGGAIGGIITAVMTLVIGIAGSIAGATAGASMKEKALAAEPAPSYAQAA